MAIEMTGQQRKSEQMRERILTEAETLFHEYGYKKVSVRDIAAAAGVTTGALYHHFGDKESILSAMFWRSAQVPFERFCQTDTPLEDLETLLCSTMIAPVLKDGPELTRHRLFSTMHFEYVSDFERCVAQLVEQAAGLHLLTEQLTQEEMVDFFCATYRGAVLQYAMSHVSMDLPKVMQRRFHIALRAVLKSRD